MLHPLEGPLTLCRRGESLFGVDEGEEELDAQSLEEGEILCPLLGECRTGLWCCPSSREACIHSRTG